MKKSAFILAFAAGVILISAYFDSTDASMGSHLSQPSITSDASTKSPPAKSSSPEQAVDTGKKIDDPTTEQQVAPSMDDELKSFIASGNPEQVMNFFKEQRRARAQLITTQMTREGVDHLWSQQVTEQFDMAGQLFPKIKSLKLTGADCRETICALNVTLGSFENYKQVEPLISKVGILLGTDAWIHHDASPNGPVIYISRPDGVLPDLS